MNIEQLKTKTINALKKKNLKKTEALIIYRKVIKALEQGTVRVAEKRNNRWIVNNWLKKVILLGFKHGELRKFTGNFYDKKTLPLRKLKLGDKIRMVPGGSTIRCGTYLAPGTIIMSPAYVNIGAYIDSGTMIDSHALVGSCAQIGKNVHLSAASQIGGVLEPVGAMPVIIEDNVFIGGNSGIYEGTIIKKGAVIASGVILTGSTPIFDTVNNRFIKKTKQGNLIVPENAVVVAGSRPIKSGSAKKHGMHIYCPIIIKYKNNKTSASIALEGILR